MSSISLFYGAHYRRLTSLQDYVLVSQHRPLVERFTRHDWIPRMGEGLEAILPLLAMGCELPLADIYDKVSFGRDDFMMPNDTVASPSRVPGADREGIHAFDQRK